MILGRVIGQVWGARRVKALGPEKMLLVAELGTGPHGTDDSATGRVVVALDNIGARLGERVTVSWGSGARAVLSRPDNRHLLADAAISRIVDGTTMEQED